MASLGCLGLRKPGCLLGRESASRFWTDALGVTTSNNRSFDEVLWRGPAQEGNTFAPLGGPAQRASLNCVSVVRNVQVT
jgi:hypothetical protein